MFRQIWQKLKELINRLKGTNRSIEQVLGIKPTISSEMIDAIELWSQMYQNKSHWLKEPTNQDPTRVTSLNLPALICCEKARTCTLEMKSEVTPVKEEVDDVDEMTGLQVKKDVAVGDISRAEYLNEQYQDTIMKDIRKQLEYGIAKGGLVIKPYVVMNKGQNAQFDTNSVKTEGIKEEGQSGIDTKDAKENPFNKNKQKEQKTDTQVNDEFNNEVINQPNASNGKILMDYVQADGFYPIAFDGSGRMTEAAFVQKIVNKDNTYSRLEYHKLEGNTVTVMNKAFKALNTQGATMSDNSTELGTEIPLTQVPEWADLEEETTIQNVDRLLFAYFKMPIANTIDTYSPLGVSGFSRAVSTIQDADEQYSRILWEFEGSQLAIDADRDALVLERDDNGNDITVHSKLQQRLFRKVDLNDEQSYNVFSPAIRDTSLFNGLNNILMRIEDQCELARGTIADVTQEARTATEIAVLKQRSYSANTDLQKALQDALEDVVYIMDVYATLYNLAPQGEYDTSFEWDDSIQVDKESEMNKRLALVNAGLDSKVNFRMWYFGETEEQAMQALAKIQEFNNFQMMNSPEFQQFAQGDGDKPFPPKNNNFNKNKDKKPDDKSKQKESKEE